MIRTVRLSACLRHATAMAALAFLGACNSHAELSYAQWKQMQPPPALEVKRTPVAHSVNFGPGEVSVSSTESTALSEFLAAQELAPGEQVKVEAPSVAPADTDRVARRVEAVRNQIEAQGMPVE